MGLYCEIPGDIERTFIKEGERRLPYFRRGDQASTSGLGRSSTRQYSPCQTQPVQSWNFYRGTWALPARLLQVKTDGYIVVFTTGY